MIKVRIGRKVYEVRDSSSYEAASREMAVAWRKECIARESKANAAREAAALADGWVRGCGTLLRWTRGAWEVHGTPDRLITTPVSLWVRKSARHKWHRVYAGGWRSDCAAAVWLRRGREVSSEAPPNGVCGLCAKLAGGVP